jgi:hypothetical protein
VTALVGGKGYHFADAPSVEYDGAVPPEKRDALLPLLNERLRALVAADERTRAWALVRDGGGAADAQLAQLLGGARALEHYAPGKLVRVVAVGAADNTCPCGGTHVRSTAQLRGVTVTKIKVAKGSTKLSYVLA